MLAVNTAIVTIEAIIHTIATTRPSGVREPKFPVLRCVIATVDHQTPELNPLAKPPPKSSLWRRSKNQTRNPTANASPIRAKIAWAKPNEVKVRIIGCQAAASSGGNSDTKSGCVEGLREIQKFLARCRHGQGRYGNIEFSRCYAINQSLHIGFLGKPVVQVQLVRDATPEVDADALPSAVGSLHRKGRRLFRANDQFPLGRSISILCYLRAARSGES